MTESKRYGIIGLVAVPLVLGTLVFIREKCPYDSAAYTVLQKIFWIPSFPFLWVTDIILKVCGLHWDKGLKYWVHIRVLMFVYWAALGFGLGYLSGRLKEKIRSRSKCVK